MSGAHRRFTVNNEEKFPFQSRGNFKVASGVEKLLAALVAAVFVLGLIGIFTGVPALFTTPPENEDAFHWEEGDTSWHLFAAITELAAVVILGFICAFALKIVLNGKTAHYDADSYRFCVTVDNEKEVFFYNEVTSVAYDPIMLLGRIRGYRVDIRTSKGSRIYSYSVVLNKATASPKPDATPFVILEEKAGLRRAGQDTVYAREEKSMNTASIRGMSAPDLPLPSQTGHSVTDNMTDEEYLQYLRSHASEVREIKRSPENAPQQVDTEDMTDEEYSAYLKAKRAASPKIPEIARPSVLSHDMGGIPTVSPIKAENISDTPQAEEDSTLPSLSLEKSDRRELPKLSPALPASADPTAHPKFRTRETVSKGQFRTPFRHERLIRRAIMIIAPLGLVDCAFDNISAFAASPTVENFTRYIGFLLLFSLFWLAICYLFTKIVEIGKDISYEADSTKFVLYDNKNTTVMKYEDIISVKFYPLKRGFAQRGWSVSVVTPQQTYTYGCLFPTGKEYVAERETPFRYLLDNIAEK